MSNLGLVLLYKASLWRTSGFLWGDVRQYAELGCKKGWRNKKEVLKHLQSDQARAYRDYNVISGVGVWCQVEVRVYDKKVPGVRMALVARNINSVWPLLCWEWWQCVTNTHTHTFIAIWLLNVTGGFADDLFLQETTTNVTLEGDKRDLKGEEEREHERKTEGDKKEKQ